MPTDTPRSQDIPRSSAKRDWVHAFEPVLVVGLVALLLLLFDVGCPFRFLLGVSCPGCGTTRAWLAFLTGDVDRALALNPLFWAPIAAIVLYGMSGRFGRWAQVAALVLGVAMVGLWALRMGSATGLFEVPWIAPLDPNVVVITDPGILEWVRSIG